MIHLLMQKQKHSLNNQFQKYRKQVFMKTFEYKMTNLSNLVEKKIKDNKRDVFKELVNFCLRNEQFKKQYD